MENDFQFISSNEEEKVVPSLKQERKKQPFASILFNGKSKILASFYNYVHSFPNELPPFSSSDIWLMGRNFSRESKNNAFERMTVEDSPGASKKPYQRSIPTHIEQFLTQFASLLWFCYRKDFPPLETHLTTDLGWGCMLRTGQMMTARVLVRQLLGTDWHYSQQEQNFSFETYKKIVDWFADSPSPECHYSIHNMVQASRNIDQKMGKSNQRVGEWFTPARVAQIIKQLVMKHNPGDLQVYISKDGVLYRDKLYRLCSGTESLTIDTEIPWKPIFIIIPVRLGVEKINTVYIENLKLIFQSPQSVGIIGGRPRQSLYFVGYQDDDVFYLDPHIVKTYSRREENPENYHCNTPGKVKIANLDPSLAIGFYCQNLMHLEELLTLIEGFSKLSHPILSVANTTPNYQKEEQGFEFL